MAIKEKKARVADRASPIQETCPKKKEWIEFSLFPAPATPDRQIPHTRIRITTTCDAFFAFQNLPRSPRPKYLPRDGNGEVGGWGGLGGVDGGGKKAGWDR